MRNAFSLALAALLAGTAPAALLAEASEPTPAAAEVLPAITVSTVTKRKVTDIVLASGLIAPIEEVQVAPLIEGQQIEALLADVGDRVEAGQVLARLSVSTLELQRSQLAATVAAAKAAVAQAEAGLIESESTAAEARRVADRTAKLQAQGTTSQAAADQAAAAATSAEAGVAVARQALESARANQTLAEAQAANTELQLSRTEVTAPVSGVISARNARIGAIASAAGQPMFTLIRDGALEMQADVAERDLLRLAPGQSATLTLSGADKPMTGTLRLVEPTIDAVTRLGRVRIVVEDPAAVRAGMFAEAAITIAEHEALAVPVTAVGSSSGFATVMKLAGDTVARTDVTTGIREGGWVEIVSGLAEGDKIVTKAGAFVRNGDRINPVPAASN